MTEERPGPNPAPPPPPPKRRGWATRFLCVALIGLVTALTVFLLNRESDVKPPEAPNSSAVAESKPERQSEKVQRPAQRPLVVTIVPPTATLSSPSSDVYISGVDGTWQVEASDVSTPPVTVVASLEGYNEQQITLDAETLQKGFLNVELKPVALSPGEAHRFTGHTAPVRSVAISSDGKWAASGGNDKSIRLWDLTTMQAAKVLNAHQGAVLALAFTPDSRWLASGSSDKVVRLWDVETGELVRELPAQSGPVEAVAFSPDGAKLVTAGGSFDAKKAEPVGCYGQLWNLNTGRELIRLTGHRNIVTAVTFSPDGNSLLTGSADSSMRLWDAESGASGQVFLGHLGRVSSVAFSPGGSQAASAGNDKTVRLWSVPTGQNIRQLVGHEGPVRGLAYVDDRRLVSVSEDGTTRLWDLVAGTQLESFAGHEGSVNAVSVSRDGNLAVTAGSDQTVRLWRLPVFETDQSPETPAEILSEKRKFTSPAQIVWDLSLSLDRRTFAAACDDHAVRIWKLDSGAPIRVLDKYTNSLCGVTWDTFSDEVIAASQNGRITVWKAADWTLLHSWLTDEGIRSLSVSPRTNMLYTCGLDGRLRSMEIGKNKNANMLFNVGSALRTLAGSPAKSLVVFAGEDKTVYVGDDSREFFIRRLRGHNAMVNQVDVGPEGRFAASASDDGTVRLWDLAEGKEAYIWTLESERMRAVAFSPDGKRLAAGSESGTLYVWDIDGHQLLYRCFGHTGYITDLEFPTSEELLSASRDGTCRLWDLKE